MQNLYVSDRRNGVNWCFVKEKLPPVKRDEVKEWAVIKVEEEFGLNKVSDDEADAILIGQARINQMQTIAKKNQKQKK